MSALTFSIPSLGCVCTFNGLVCVRARIYIISFLGLCICVYSYICMRPCLSLSLSPCLSLALRPLDSPAVLTLASPYAVEDGTDLSQREEMRDGINEGERGHRCQRRMRVWILSHREHVGVAFLSQRGWKKGIKRGVEGKPSERLSSRREGGMKGREGVAGLSQSTTKWKGAWLDVTHFELSLTSQTQCSMWV